MHRLAARKSLRPRNRRRMRRNFCDEIRRKRLHDAGFFARGLLHGSDPSGMCRWVFEFFGENFWKTLDLNIDVHAKIRRKKPEKIVEKRFFSTLYALSFRRYCADTVNMVD